MLGKIALWNFACLRTARNYAPAEIGLSFVLPPLSERFEVTSIEDLIGKCIPDKAPRQAVCQGARGRARSLKFVVDPVQAGTGAGIADLGQLGAAATRQESILRSRARPRAQPLRRGIHSGPNTTKTQKAAKGAPPQNPGPGPLPSKS